MKKTGDRVETREEAELVPGGGLEVPGEVGVAPVGGVRVVGLGPGAGTAAVRLFPFLTSTSSFCPPEQ